MSLTDQMVRQAHIRRAKDFVTALKSGGDTHRDAHNSVIDYRLQDIMGGTARSVGTVPGFCEDKPAFGSPWHYHDCEMQIGIVLDGSVEMALADGEYTRIATGDIGMIPGGVIHDVSHPSADYLTTEFSFPGTFETIDAPPPPAGSSSAAVKLGISAAMRSGERGGLLFYDYPVAAPYDERYRLRRHRRSRVAPFEEHSLRHADEYLLLYVMKGTRTLRVDDREEVLGPGDLLVLPGGIDVTDLDASEEHEALGISLLPRANAPA